MSEFTLESESIDVERIMEQIRTRIREKRDESYSEELIHELANATIKRFFDPTHAHSSTIAYYQKRLREKQKVLRTTPQIPPSFTFDPDIIYRSSRGFSGRILYRFRKLLSPILKFFFNPAPIVHALTMQQQINERHTEVISQMVRSQTEFVEIAAMNYEVMNHLVVEMTRLSIEMKNHKMLVESVARRLDFDDRRGRGPERPPIEHTNRDRVGSSDAHASSEKPRRRRRRGRRRSGTTAPGNSATPEVSTEPVQASGRIPQTAEPSAGTEAPTVSGSTKPSGSADATGPTSATEPMSSPDVPGSPVTGGGSSGQ